MSKGAPGIPKTEAHKQAIRAALKNKPKSESHKQKLRDHVRTEQHNINLKTSLNEIDVKLKRKKTMVSLYGVEHATQKPELNMFRKEYWIDKGLSVAEASLKVSTIQKAYCRQRKSITSHWQVAYWTKRGMSFEEAKTKISELQCKNSSKSTMIVSKSETKFLNDLEIICDRKIERSVVLCNKFIVDGFEPKSKIIIEYFGDFWHMNPTIYKENDVNSATNERAGSKWAEDGGRVKYLEKCGYKVFVVWESDDRQEKIKEIMKEICNESI